MKKIIIIMLMLFLQLNSYHLQLSFSSGDEQFAYDNEGMRDPFMPLLTKDGKPVTTYGSINTIGDVIIEGILYDPSGNSVVIINDLILGKGDSISGITVKKIDKNSVTLFF